MFPCLPQCVHLAAGLEYLTPPLPPPPGRPGPQALMLLRLQEAGRAGRDGIEACCVLFYSYGDKVTAVVTLLVPAPAVAN